MAVSDFGKDPDQVMSESSLEVAQLKIALAQLNPVVGDIEDMQKFGMRLRLQRVQIFW